MIFFKETGKYVFFSSDIKKEVQKIQEILTFEVPGHEHSSFYKDDKWDGNKLFYSKTKQCFELTLLDYVVKRLIKNKIPYDLQKISKQNLFDTDVNKNYLLKHQYEAAITFINHQPQTGIIKIPTRGGKTIFASEMIRLFCKKTSGKVLFIVDTIDLFDQAVREIGKYLKCEIGLINADNFVIKDVSVASIQTLIARLKNKTSRNEYLRYLNQVKFLVVDEIHEVSSDKRINVISKIKYISCLGLSATPFGVDEIDNMKVRRYSGDIVYEITEQELVQAKVLAESKVFLINVDYMENKYINIDYNEFERLRGAARYQYLNNEVIINNDYRNNICTSLIEIFRKLKLKVLVLVSQHKHGYKLSSITGDVFLNGSHASDVRTFEKGKFLKSKGGVIIASDIWKKGITLPEVDVVIIMGGGKDQNMLIQRKGRVLGTTKNKKQALIVDFIDNFDEYFNNHSLNRIAVYEKSVGGENIDVFTPEDIEFYNDFRKSVKNWFGVT